MQSGHAYWPGSREREREREREGEGSVDFIGRDKSAALRGGRKKHVLATHVQQLPSRPCTLTEQPHPPSSRSQSRLISLSEKSDAWAARHRRVRSLGYRDDKLDLLSVVGVEVSGRISVISPWPFGWFAGSRESHHIYSEEMFQRRDTLVNASPFHWNNYYVYMLSQSWTTISIPNRGEGNKFFFKLSFLFEKIKCENLYRDFFYN